MLIRHSTLAVSSISNVEASNEIVVALTKSVALAIGAVTDGFDNIHPIAITAGFVSLYAATSLSALSICRPRGLR